jgi:hypothetical protein
MKFEYRVWLNLLSNNAISGDLKIECIKKYIPLGKDVRTQLVLLNGIREILDNHTKDKACDHFAYRWLENYYPFLKEDPKSLTKKTKWENEIELPLINMFEKFEIQYCYKNSLEHKKAVIKNYENWDILIHDDCFIKVLDFVDEEIKKLNKIKGTNIKAKTEKTISNHCLGFGFNGDKKKLYTVVSDLCKEIDLLNEDKTNAQNLVDVFISKNIYELMTVIHLDCETKHFRYCINKFMPYFNSLTLANIEKSKIFFSKRGRMIKANNLASSSSKGKVEPKKKLTIDRIFKEMQ